MKQQIRRILLLHLQKLLQLILWRLMELPLIRIVMMLSTLVVSLSLSVYHLPTYPFPWLSVSHRNDLTGSWCCKAGCKSACCCSCWICSALAKLRGWGHRSAPAWMKAGLNASVRNIILNIFMTMSVSYTAGLIVRNPQLIFKSHQ